MKTLEKFFNQSATIQQPQVSYENNYHEPILEWVDFKEVAGRLRPLSSVTQGRINIAASKEAAFVSHRFYCPYFDDEIPPSCSILIDDERYMIRFVQDVMTMHRLLQIDLEQVI